MTNGLLINYSGVPHEISSLFPDNGLASLAAVLEKNNHHVKIFDFSTTTTIKHVYSKEIKTALESIAPIVFGDRMLNEKETSRLLEIEGEIKKNETHFLDRELKGICSHIEQNNVSWIGFKLWMGGIQQSMYMASKLKLEFPKLKVFAGGPSIDLFQEAILEKYDVIDTLIFSEAEEALPMLIDSVDGKQDLSKINNLIYRNGSNITKTKVKRIENLDILPYPDYDKDIYSAMSGHQKMKIMCFDESRGCPMGCAFCPDVNKFKKQRFEKTSKRCVDEIEYLKNKYQISYFRFSGSNSSVTLLEQIADGIISRNLSIVFSVFSSAIGLNARIIEKLANAGLFGVFIGVESADQMNLKKYLRKANSPEKIKEIVDCCKKNQIFISMSMIYPTPFADDTTFSQNIDFLISCLKGYEKSSVPLFPAGLYPYTQWFENLDKFGFSIKCDSKKEYINALLSYSFNLILPRYLWKELPYSLNGKTFKELLLETFMMSTELKKNGILPYFPEANLMMAPILGYDDYKIFAREVNLAFFSGNTDILEMWNEKFNRTTMV